MRMDPAVAAVRLAVRSELGDLAPGDLVLAAVSGGADSMSLAAALAAEAPKLALRAGAITVDHGLQDGSASRAAQVAANCAGLGLDPVVVERVSVSTGGGPEAAAREARYAAIDAVASRTGAQAVLLGHTLDDQAETVLLGLGRGSGARSLAGMAVRRGELRRPLLGIRRSDTEAACAALGMTPWCDPHNVDRSYARARVRSVALPALEAAVGPGVANALARTAGLLRADADALDAWADAVSDTTDVRTLEELPAAVRTRVLRRAAIEAGVAAGPLSADHIRDIDRLVTDWRGQGPVSLPGGFRAQRAYDRLTFR
jgi:tRNA(Ile)-lysidine synthase